MTENLQHPETLWNPARLSTHQIARQTHVKSGARNEEPQISPFILLGQVRCAQGVLTRMVDSYRCQGTFYTSTVFMRCKEARSNAHRRWCLADGG